MTKESLRQIGVIVVLFAIFGVFVFIRPSQASVDSMVRSTQCYQRQTAFDIAYAKREDELRDERNRRMVFLRPLLQPTRQDRVGAAFGLVLADAVRVSHVRLVTVTVQKDQTASNQSQNNASSGSPESVATPPQVDCSTGGIAVSTPPPSVPGAVPTATPKPAIEQVDPNFAYDPDHDALESSFIVVPLSITVRGTYGQILSFADYLPRSRKALIRVVSVPISEEPTSPGVKANISARLYISRATPPAAASGAIGATNGGLNSAR